MALDALLTHCHLADGRLVDIGIAGGHIATIGEDAAPSLSNRVPILDIGGDLVLLGLVDGHMHLDKTLMGLPWMPHGGTDADEPLRPTKRSCRTCRSPPRSAPVIRSRRASCAAPHLRTHVDMISKAAF